MTIGRLNRCGLLVLGAAALLACSPAWGAGVTIAVPKATGAPGSEVKVPILVRGAQGIGAMQMDLVYDAAVLSPTAVEPSGLLSGLVEHNAVRPGRLRIALATARAVSGDGEILTASFKVLGGSESALRLENGRAWALADSTDVAVAMEGGHFTVGSSRALYVVAGAVAAGVLLLVLVVLRLRRKRRPARAAA